MNTTKKEQDSTESQLDAALGQSAEAAVSLGINETELVDRLLDQFHSKATSNIVPMSTHVIKKMCNPEAGP